MRIHACFERPDSDLAFARSSGRASQTATTHHHTSEHSNFRTIQSRRLNQLWVRQPIAKNPGQFSCKSTKSSTRVQTHQNLFTLTKEHFCSPSTIQPGEQNSNPSQPDLCRNQQRKIETRFPHNISEPIPIHTTGGDGRDRTDDLLLAKQALYQLSYAPN